MNVLVDMNLPPSWVPFLAWSAVGDPRATDQVVMEWARTHRYVVFTNDLDFSALIASSGVSGPSVVQVRAQDLLPSANGADVVMVLIDEVAARVRILPIRKKLQP